jgi:DNA-binding transcriptional LysR family regulator
MLNEIDLSRTDLNLLVIFETVLAERNVGRAADRLNLSPSAVSHGLGRLRRLLNDPLFLKTPKGVVPTARASELAEPIADILARTRRVIATAEPFNSATSRRRFMIGAPDASAFFLTPLYATLSRDAPGIDIGLRQILTRPSLTSPWDDVLAELDAHTVDIAIAPTDDVPARFAERVLYGEEFVIAMRCGHPFAEAPTLSRYCEMRHLLVSFLGDTQGFIDGELAKLGLSRRVVMTVPNFMLALAIVRRRSRSAASAFAQSHRKRR